MKSINKILAAIAILFISQQTYSQEQTLFKGIAHPESVIIDSSYIYVSDIGLELNPMQKDADGKIWRLTKGGQMVDNDFFKATLHAPKGMAILNNKLYIADIDRIVIFNTKTGQLVKEISLQNFGVNLVNDLCIANGKEIYATSTDLGKVLKIPLTTDPKIEMLNIPIIEGANGISFNTQSNKLAIVGLGSFTAKEGTGSVYTVDITQPNPITTRIEGITGFLDGVEWFDQDHLIVDDWKSLSETKGQIYVLNIVDGSCTKLNHAPIGGTADFYVDRSHQRILIPSTLQGSLVQLPL